MKNLGDIFNRLVDVKGFEEFGRNTLTAVSASGQSVSALAAKHNVPLVNNNAYQAYQVGCPAIVNPLVTEDIRFGWGSGRNNEDKQGRFDQLNKALQTIEAFTTGQDIKAMFLDLNLYGRAMFTHIASLNDDLNDVVLATVAPYASEGLDMSAKTYPNCAIANDKIYAHYVAPKVANFEKAQISEKAVNYDVIDVEVTTEEMATIKLAPNKDVQNKEVSNKNEKTEASAIKITETSKVEATETSLETKLKSLGMTQIKDFFGHYTIGEKNSFHYSKAEFNVLKGFIENNHLTDLPQYKAMLAGIDTQLYIIDLE